MTFATHLLATGRTLGPYLTVANADSPAEVKSSADFICDNVGNNDQVQINAAILEATHLTARGGPAGAGQRGAVHLAGGRFNCNAPILMRTGVTLAGAGLLTEIRAVNNTATGMVMAFDTTLHFSVIRDMWLSGNYAAGGTTSSGIHYISVAGGNYPTDPPAGNDPKNRVQNMLIQGFTNNPNRHGIVLTTDMRGSRITDIYMRDIGGNGIWLVSSPDSHVYESSIGTVGGRGIYIQGANNSIANTKIYYCDIAGLESTSGYAKLSNIEVQDSVIGFRLAGTHTTATGLLADTCDATGIELASNGTQLNGFTIAHRGGGRYPNMDVGLAFTGTPNNCTVIGRVDTTNITTRITGASSGVGNFVRVTGNSSLLSVG